MSILYPLHPHTDCISLTSLTLALFCIDRKECDHHARTLPPGQRLATSLQPPPRPLRHRYIFSRFPSEGTVIRKKNNAARHRHARWHQQNRPTAPTAFAEPRYTWKIQRVGLDTIGLGFQAYSSTMLFEIAYILAFRFAPLGLREDSKYACTISRSIADDWAWKCQNMEKPYTKRVTLRER